MDIDEIRRENGRRLIKQHTATHIAKLLGHSGPSTLTQTFGPNPTRPPTDKMMRKIEEALNLPRLSTDQLPTDKPTLSVETVAEVIRMVGEMLESEAVQLAPKRFADVVALAYTDSVEHGGKPREAHIRSVVRLLK